RQRTGLYLLMLGVSLVAAVLAVVVGQRLKPRLGTWNASLVAGAGFAAVVGVVMAVLPPLGHLSANVVDGVQRARETPRPLRDPEGNTVSPGSPADILAEFRVYAVGAQLILWTAIGLLFAPLADRLLAPAAPRPAAHAAA